MAAGTAESALPIFVSGGPMLAGHVHGKKRSLSTMF